MKRQPQKKKRPALWIACLAVIVGITAARVICHVSGVDWSDTLTRVLGGIEIIAAAALAFTFVQSRRNQR